MSIKEHIIAAAERAFDLHGFTATGVDRLTEIADVSSRTLYKHVGSKTALITAVLDERGRRFFSQLQVQSVNELFVALENWTVSTGARGCLFLRALGETGGEVPEVSDAVASYRRELSELISRLVANDAPQSRNDLLAEQVLVIFEGAISAASYRGAAAISSARAAATALLAIATATNNSDQDGPRAS